jgi:hypothetical protein
MLTGDRLPSDWTGASAPQASSDSGGGTDLAAQIESLRDENAGLASVLCGLCIGLSQISEVNRAIVAQALDNADGFVASGELGVAGALPGSRTGPQAIDQIRRLVMSRQSEARMRY